jgi:deoxyribodipyrimidine photo-lyase
MPRTALPPPPNSYAVHWFRRDLRTAGNPALQRAWKEHHGRVLGLFCFDHQFLARPDFSPDRFAFFLQTLQSLREDLCSLGSDLLVLDVGPREAFDRLFDAIRRHDKPLPGAVTFNRDYEPFARRRDEDMARHLSMEFGLHVQTERDHLLIEPHELVRGDGGFYQVFTPFSRRWFDQLHSAAIQERIDVQAKALAALKSRLSKPSRMQPFSLTWMELFGGRVPLEDVLDRYAEKNKLSVTVPIPDVGTTTALDKLAGFGRDRLDAYATDRDLPNVPGTSQMSIYLKNGTLTTAQILAALDLGEAKLDAGARQASRTTYVKELVWREFYYHILYHRPDVETTAFHEKYRELPWENNETWFAAWCAGRTGYPIVDAGMRQLRETGWMHNRVRMIVASFLTKDLLIDWRWGERYFMQKLLDGDLAPNNGGWQWAASTGCDPQPYFRIFNPKLQGEKFDPDGEYVRRWVPELRDVPNKFIHEPHGRPEAKGYVRPIVEHSAQKAKALALYKAI